MYQKWFNPDKRPSEGLLFVVYWHVSDVLLHSIICLHSIAQSARDSIGKECCISFLCTSTTPKHMKAIVMFCIWTNIVRFCCHLIEVPYPKKILGVCNFKKQCLA